MSIDLSVDMAVETAIVLLQGGSLANGSKCGLIVSQFAYSVLVILIYSSLNFMFPIVRIA